MIWTAIGSDTWTSGDYRVVRKMLGGFDVWVYSLDFCGILKRGVKSLDEAQKLCETHHRGKAA